MIYLDYSATTPVDESILSSYIKTTREYIGNANSMHSLGVKSKELLTQATNQIADIFKCHPKEIIFTSGASESNATAIKGIAYRNKSKGKHIISTVLEHKSILETLSFLSLEGFEISFVGVDENGKINLKDLENLIRKDTILVSVCAVNSEIGIEQPLEKIKKIIKKKNSNTIFHSDMTQAIGKTHINLDNVDMASFSSHKIYAPKGCGILYKKREIQMNPLIYGLTENCPQRGGTPALPLIVAFSKAIRITNEELDKRIEHCSKLRKILIEGLKDYPIIINSSNECVPQIFNISLLEIKSETFLHALENYDVYVSTTTACSSGNESYALKAMCASGKKDSRASKTSIRISLSHLTTEEEINEFIKIFGKVWNELLLK